MERILSEERVAFPRRFNMVDTAKLSREVQDSLAKRSELKAKLAKARAEVETVRGEVARLDTDLIKAGHAGVVVACW
jgi:hypothetical protein